MGAPTEGALAPDLGYRGSRTEALREIPGMRKPQRTWKDEVKDRVRNRRETRGGNALPLFPDDPALDADMAPASMPFADESQAGEPYAVTERFEAPATAAHIVELGDEPLDLPLRQEPEASPREPEQRPARRSREPRERLIPASAPAPSLALGDPPPRESGSSDDWSLGMTDDRDRVAPAPVQRPASIGERAIAGAIDAVLVLSLWWLVVYFAGRAAHAPLSALATEEGLPWLAGYLAFLGLTYAAYFTGTTGQTLGKIASGLRVVDTAGRPPGYGRAFARAALGGLGTILLGGGLVPMFLDPARRALHDRLLGTRVVKH